jgi:hypothetical protein
LGQTTLNCAGGGVQIARSNNTLTDGFTKLGMIGSNNTATDEERLYLVHRHEKLDHLEDS